MQVNVEAIDLTIALLAINSGFFSRGDQFVTVGKYDLMLFWFEARRIAVECDLTFEIVGKERQGLKLIKRAYV